MSAGQNGSCETSGEVRMLAGQNFGYEISEWNEGFPSGWNEGFSSGWNEEFPSGRNERCHVSQGARSTVGGCASS